MSIVDWLWEHSIVIVAGIVSIWCLFTVADHLRGNRENYLQPGAFSDSENEEWEQGECREPCPPQVTLLAEYARSDSSGLRIAQKTEADEDFEAFRETSAARIILIDLVKITGTLADDSEGPCWDQVDLLRSFGAASGDRDISRMLRTPTMALLEGYRIKQSSTLLALWVLAVRNDPDRHRLRDMYIGFARLAAEYNMERLDEVIKMIWDASEPEVEVYDDAVHGVEAMRADLAEQLNARHREVLGVAANSTREEIRAAYHRQVVLWHPDRLEGMAPELRAVATERLKQINEAYEWMSDSVGS